MFLKYPYRNMYVCICHSIIQYHLYNTSAWYLGAISIRIQMYIWEAWFRWMFPILNAPFPSFDYEHFTCREEYMYYVHSLKNDNAWTLYPPQVTQPMSIHPRLYTFFFPVTQNSIVIISLLFFVIHHICVYPQTTNASFYKNRILCCSVIFYFGAEYFCEVNLDWWIKAG